MRLARRSEPYRMCTEVGCPRCDRIPARVLCVAAPTGLNEIAQGNALENKARKGAALKGLNGEPRAALGLRR